MYSVCKELVELLKEKSLTISSAESCTGGLIGKMITDVPGSSEVYLGGVISYTNEVKNKVLNVKNETLDKYTAVSPNTAKEMANGVRNLLGSDIAISTTGYAGPGGGTENDPVGTVYMGISYLDKCESVRFYSDSLSREEIRESATLDLIFYIIKKIKENY